MLVAQSCPTLCDPMDCSPPGSSVLGDSSGKNARMGCQALLLGIFLTQGSNPGLTHCRQILCHLSHQGRVCQRSIGFEVFVCFSSSIMFFHSRSSQLSLLGLWTLLYLGDSLLFTKDFKILFHLTQQSCKLRRQGLISWQVRKPKMNVLTSKLLSGR